MSRRHGMSFALALAAAVCSHAAWAEIKPAPQEAASPTVKPREAVAVEASKGHELVLEGGERVRLTAIRAPEPEEENRPAEPLWQEAMDALNALVRGKRVTLTFGAKEKDRHGRLLAQVTGAEGGWIQGEMVKAGMAYVYSFPDNAARASELLTLEREARAAKRGVWANAYYAVIGQEEAEKHLDQFKIVEGTVQNAANVKGTVYLNFGEDWKTDFTLLVPKSAQPLFLKAGMDLSVLAGKRIRTRGWIEPKNGPMIELSHPEQLEILSEDATAKAEEGKPAR